MNKEASYLFVCMQITLFSVIVFLGIIQDFTICFSPPSNNVCILFLGRVYGRPFGMGCKAKYIIELVSESVQKQLFYT